MGCLDLHLQFSRRRAEEAAQPELGLLGLGTEAWMWPPRAGMPPGTPTPAQFLQPICPPFPPKPPKIAQTSSAPMWGCWIALVLLRQGKQLASAQGCLSELCHQRTHYYIFFTLLFKPAQNGVHGSSLPFFLTTALYGKWGWGIVSSQGQPGNIMAKWRFELGTSRTNSQTTTPVVSKLSGFRVPPQPLLSSSAKDCHLSWNLAWSKRVAPRRTVREATRDIPWHPCECATMLWGSGSQTFLTAPSLDYWAIGCSSP